jgi:nucleoside-diphosphate-sugar epimerase
MNILVTGGSGFIGSNLSDYLVNKGHSVSVIDNLSTGYISNLSSMIDARKDRVF